MLRYPITFGDALVLRMRHLWMRNSYFPLAVVHLRPGGRGTQVEVTLRSHYLLAAFMTFWLGFAIIMSLVVLVAIVGGHAPTADLWFILPFPLFGLGLLAVGRAFGERDGRALLEFISRVLDAHEVPVELRPLC